MNDNAKGPAKSAGAQLRRYGEQALRDVRSELNCDSPLIDASARTFVDCWKLGVRKLHNAKEFGSEQVHRIVAYFMIMKMHYGKRATLV